MKQQLITWTTNIFVVGLVLSIPSLLFAAYWFDNSDLAWWAVLPFIILMAG